MKLANKHCDDDRIILDLNEIKSMFVSLIGKNLFSDSVINALLNDFVSHFENSGVDYEDFYDFSILFYGSKIRMPEVIEQMVEYYVNQGFDDDELSQLGSSRSCKLLKAISEMHPTMNTNHSHLFFRSCLNYIKHNYKSFTTMQLKRVVDFIDNVDYFKEETTEMGDFDTIRDIIKEIKGFYEQKVLVKSMNSSGLNLEMTTGETILREMDEEDFDPLFEEDESDEEENQETMKAYREEIIKMRNPEEQIRNLFGGDLDFDSIPYKNPPHQPLHPDFDDPKLQRLTEMIDSSYEKYGNLNKKK